MNRAGRVLAMALVAWAALGAALAPWWASAVEAVVVIGANGFDPPVVEVSHGTTVTWVNQDGERHRIRFTGGLLEFDSGNLDPGGSFSFTFDGAGSHPYRDERNPDSPAFQGTVTVVEGTAGSPAAGGPGATPAPTSGRVGMAGSAFSPGTLTVAVGATITWVNDDDRPHTVTAADGSFDSGLMQPGATFTRTFDRPGTYRYSCLLHSDMLGTVVVTDASGNAPPAPPSDSTLPAPGAQPPPPSAQVPGAGSVRMEDNRFGPATLPVRAGTTVTWVNVGRVIHTATARDGSFDSGLVQPGGRFSRRFDTPGTYEYYCIVHPEMVGTIVVTDAAGAAPPAGLSAAAPTTTSTAADHAGHGEATTVEVLDQAYAPRALTVVAGTRVTFHNVGVQPHTVTARDGSFDSGVLLSGESWAITFGTVGTYEYFCTLHPEMVGTVTVIEAPPVGQQVAAAPPTTTAAVVLASLPQEVITSWVGPLALGVLLGGLAVGLVGLGRAMSAAGNQA